MGFAAAVWEAAAPKPLGTEACVVPKGPVDMLAGAAEPKPPVVLEEAPKPLTGLGAAPNPVDAAAGCVGVPNAGVDVG